MYTCYKRESAEKDFFLTLICGLVRWCRLVFGVRVRAVGGLMLGRCFGGGESGKGLLVLE